MLTRDKILDWIKLSPRYLLGISIFTGLLLFLKETNLKELGLDGFVNQWRSIIGGVFLFSITLLAVHGAAAGYQFATKKYADFRTNQRRTSRLHNLTREEKQILLGYVLGETMTQKFAYPDGVVRGLQATEILYFLDVGEMAAWPCNIQPWAWEYIKKHQDEIFTKEEIEEYKELGISAEKQSRQRAGFIW